MQVTVKEFTIIIALISIVIVGLVLTLVFANIAFVGSSLVLMFILMGLVVEIEESNKRKQPKRKVVYYIKRK
jgi:undecaprenyl pyrophosphate phosphatase UppP